jgi:uncharacterized protein YcfJ
MRKSVYTLAMILAVTSVRGQIFSNESLTGALMGGIIGGVIGHNHHRQTAEGAAIGAGAGWLLGTIVHNQKELSRQENSYYQPTTTTYSYQPVYTTTYTTTTYTRPNYAIGGVILGGIVGGVIGHNHHRQTAEGIAIGAASGLVLGTLAEQNARLKERNVLVTQPQTVYYPVVQTNMVVVQQPVQQQITTPVQQTVTPQQSSPMSSANSLFGR